MTESAVLVPDPHIQVDAVDGAGVVLMVGAHWGEVPWLTDQGRTASVWVELPEPAAVVSLVVVEPGENERRFTGQTRVSQGRGPWCGALEPRP